MISGVYCSMFQFEANDAFIVERRKALDAALSTNPKTQVVLRRIIRKCIAQARKRMMSGVSFNNGDPRQAIQSIRTSVYKKILGANVNIYSSRKVHGKNNYEPPRTLNKWNRGGNRRSRSARTDQIMHYGPLDRGFILRWVNAGAHGRAIAFTENPSRKVDRWNTHPNTGNRGSIAARHWFRNASDRALAEAAVQISSLIDTEINNLLNTKG